MIKEKGNLDSNKIVEELKKGLNSIKDQQNTKIIEYSRFSFNVRSSLSNSSGFFFKPEEESR
jgi:hypothetical protein